MKIFCVLCVLTLGMFLSVLNFCIMQYLTIYGPEWWTVCTDSHRTNTLSILLGFIVQLWILSSTIYCASQIHQAD